MMTESKARSLWCPMARVVDTSIRDCVAVNRSSEDEGVAASCRCIASKCAMWRWSREDEGYGFCGLAGEGEGHAR